MIAFILAFLTIASAKADTVGVPIAERSRDQLKQQSLTKKMKCVLSIEKDKTGQNNFVVESCEPFERLN